ncbi:MAG: tetratricopeptide repeat protein [Oscillospiraceae bacterium]|nr:tetratricopeptide repeat protein [Oscillospiraceae bacterium]
MKNLLSLILALTITMTIFTSCGTVDRAFVSSYLNLGEKYLTDLDYEKAIVCFNKAIEVEPKNDRAYLGAAETYVAMGDVDSAIAILEQGIAVVDDLTELQAMHSELVGESEVESEEVATDDSSIASDEIGENEEAEAEPMVGEDENGQGEVTSSTSESQDEEDLLYLYDDVLETLYTALSEQWNFEQLEEAGLNYLYCENGYELSEIGYTYVDINGDRVMELLIGECEPYWRGYFIDLYTIVDGQVTLIVSGTERSSYYLCEDGKIYFDGSAGAANSSYEYYSITRDGRLSFIEAVIYDGLYDEDNPYFYCVTGTESSDGSMSFSEENYIPITQEKASEIINSYTTVEITFTPFSSLH